MYNKRFSRFLSFITYNLYKINQICCTIWTSMIRPFTEVIMVHTQFHIILNLKTKIIEILFYKTKICKAQTFSTVNTLFIYDGKFCSLIHVTVILPLFRRPFNFGKYSWHLTLLFSTNDVNITIDSVRCCKTILQKSKTVSGFGPWAAMYSFG